MLGTGAASAAGAGGAELEVGAVPVPNVVAIGPKENEGFAGAVSDASVKVGFEVVDVAVAMRVLAKEKPWT